MSLRENLLEIAQKKKEKKKYRPNSSEIRHFRIENPLRETARCFGSNCGQISRGGGSWYRVLRDETVLRDNRRLTRAVRLRRLGPFKRSRDCPEARKVQRAFSPRLSSSAIVGVASIVTRDTSLVS